MRIKMPAPTAAAVVLLIASLGCNLPLQNDSTPPASAVPASGTESPPTEGPEAAINTEPAAETKAPTPEAGGLKVVYTSEDQLILWSQGEARQLTQNGEVFNPVISPDGELIAFMRPADEFHLEIWAIDADGGDERKLVSVADMDAIAASVRDSSAVAVNPYPEYAWVPGTHQIGFTSQQVFQGPGLNLLNDFNLVEAESGEITNLFLSGWGGQFNFSPDGKQVALSQPDKILLANLDGSNYRSVLTYDAVTTYSEYRYYARPVWAPDSSYLMVALPPVDPLAKPAQPTELWRLEVDGAEPKMTGSIVAVPFQEQEVQFAPDLMRVAFLKETGMPDENKRELHLASIDGGGDWLYASGTPAMFFSWSPDAERFAYSVGLENELWFGSLEDPPQPGGSALMGAQSVEWVRQDQVLFWLLEGEAFELYLAELNGGLVLLDTAFNSRPYYSFTR